LSGADDFSLRILTGAVAKGLPSFTVKSLHMPSIASIHGDSSAGDDSGLAVAGADGQPTSTGRGLAGGASTFSEFIGRVVAGSGGPTVLVLLGFDKWCAEHSDYGNRPGNGIGAITQSQSEGGRAVGAPNTPPSTSAKSLNRSATAAAVAELAGSPCLNEELKASLSALRYHLDRLTFSNVLVVIPTAQSIAAGAYLPSTISRMLPTSRDSCFHNVMQFTIQPPTTADLQSFMEYVFEEKIASCVSILPPMEQWNSLEIDMHAGADLFRRFSADPARREAERKRKQEERLQRWNDIQYKRAQMRLVLRSWINQLLSTASLRPLFHGDLDLAEKPDQEEELKHWRQHVARFVANRAKEKQLLEGKQGRTRKTAANAKDFYFACENISRRQLVSNDAIFGLDKLMHSVRQIERATAREDSVWDEAPEWALCPLLSVPLRNPVALPSKGKERIIVERESIRHHCLTHAEHPYTREPMTMDEVDKFNETPDVKAEIEELKQRIKTWRDSVKEME
jgi:hypothetical protein